MPAAGQVRWYRVVVGFTGRGGRAAAGCAAGRMEAIVMRYLRAAAAAGVLLLLVVGVPLVLAATIGNPLVGWADLLAGDVSDSVVLDILAALAWAGWVQFTWVVLREAIDLARHTPRREARQVAGQVPAPQLSGVSVGGPQVAARALLSAMLMAAPLGASAHAVAAPLSGVAAGTAPANQVGSLAGAGQVGDPIFRTGAAPLNPAGTSLSASSPTVHRETAGNPRRGAQSAAEVAVVVIGPHSPRTLWDLAETQLGEGQRWREIWDLNAGRIQGDGQAMTHPGWLNAGWTVLIPSPTNLIPSPAISVNALRAASADHLVRAARGGAAPAAVQPAGTVARTDSLAAEVEAVPLMRLLDDQPQVTNEEAEVPAAPAVGGREPSGQRLGKVIVREPAGGGHDSLWRIAGRELGSSRRWPEIFRLNVGARQHDGRRLTNPDRIQPGWVLRLPSRSTPTKPSGAGQGARPGGGEARVAPGHPHAPIHPWEPHNPLPSTPFPSAPTAEPPTSTSPRSGPTSSLENANPVGSGRHQGPREPIRGIDLPSEGYVGLGFAAAITAILIMARSRRRRRQTWDQAFTVHLDDAPTDIAPPRLARLLDTAHQLGAQDDEDDEPAVGGAAIGFSPGQGSGVRASLGGALPAGEAGMRTRAGQVAEFGPIGVGTRNGLEVLLDLDTTTAVGLTGPGAEGVARALVTALLARVRHPRSAPSVTFLLPRPDAEQLFGSEVAADPPPLLTVVTDLEHAMDRLEVDMLARRRLSTYLQDPAPHPRSPSMPAAAKPPPEHEHGYGPDVGSGPRNEEGQMPMVVLVATIDEVNRFRLEAILDLGRGAGVAAILLGAWPTGPTYPLDKRADVSDQPGTRLYTLTQEDTHDLIDVIRDAFSPSQPSRPITGTQRSNTAPSLPTHPPEQDRDRDTEFTSEQRQIPATVIISSEAKPPKELLDSTVTTLAGAESPTDASDIPVARQVGDGPDPAEPSTDGPSPAATTSPGSAASIGPTGGTVLSEWKDTALTGPWSAPINVLVLGQLRLLAAGQDVRHGLRGKTQELLLFLLLHPAGVSSETAADALWPDSTDAASALRSAMKRLRAQLRNVTGLSEQMFIVFASGRYRPDRRILACDAWQFEAATRAATNVPTPSQPHSITDPGHATVPAPDNQNRPRRDANPTDAERLAALGEAVALYGGTLLDGFDYPWLEPYRQSLRHHALHVFVRYATAITNTDPETALATLERALPIDPVNETLYRRVMLLQARLHRPEAIAGTLTLLRRQLADIDERPERQTLTLAATLASSDQEPGGS